MPILLGLRTRCRWDLGNYAEPTRSATIVFGSVPTYSFFFTDPEPFKTIPD